MKIFWNNEKFMVISSTWLRAVDGKLNLQFLYDLLRWRGGNTPVAWTLVKNRGLYS